MRSLTYCLEFVNGFAFCVMFFRVTLCPLVMFVDPQLSSWTSTSRPVNIGPIMDGENCTNMADQYFSNLTDTFIIRALLAVAGPIAISLFWLTAISSIILAIILALAGVIKRCFGIIFSIVNLILQIGAFIWIFSQTWDIYRDWTCGDQHIYLLNYNTIVWNTLVVHILLIFVTIITIPYHFKCIQENNTENTYEEKQLIAEDIEKSV